MDGSLHRWFGNRKSCLIAIIDNATSEVHAEFIESETTLDCLKVLRDRIAQKGLFKTLYENMAGIFGGSNDTSQDRLVHELRLNNIARYGCSQPVPAERLNSVILA